MSLEFFDSMNYRTVFDNHNLAINGAITGTGDVSGNITTTLSPVQNLADGALRINASLGLDCSPNSLLHLAGTNNSPRILTLYEFQNDLDQFCGFGVETANVNNPGNFLRYVVPKYYGHSWQVAQPNQIPSSYEYMRLTETGLTVGLNSYTYGASRSVFTSYCYNNTLPAILAGSNFSDAAIQLECATSNGRNYQASSNTDGSFTIKDKTNNVSVLRIDPAGNLSYSRSYGNRTSALITIKNNLTATNVSNGVWAKINAVYGYTFTSDWTITGPFSANGRIIYGGGYPINALIDVQHLAYANTIGLKDPIFFAIYKNGVALTDPIFPLYGASDIATPQIFTTQALISLVTNDYLEFFTSVTTTLSGNRPVNVTNSIITITTT
jgi:hypothetical protein